MLDFKIQDFLFSKCVVSIKIDASLLFNNSKTVFNLNIKYAISVKTDVSHGVRVLKNSLLKTEYAVSWGKIRRSRVVKRVVFNKIKTQYVASDKQMRRIICIYTVQHQ